MKQYPVTASLVVSLGVVFSTWLWREYRVDPEIHGALFRACFFTAFSWTIAVALPTLLLAWMFTAEKLRRWRARAIYAPTLAFVMYATLPALISPPSQRDIFERDLGTTAPKSLTEFIASTPIIMGEMEHHYCFRSPPTETDRIIEQLGLMPDKTAEIHPPYNRPDFPDVRQWPDCTDYSKTIRSHDDDAPVITIRLRTDKSRTRVYLTFRRL